MNRLQFIMCFMISGYVVCDTKLINSEEFSENVETLRLSDEHYSAQIDEHSWFWKEYEFTSEVENREELRITDTYVWRDQNLKENITNWQYVDHNYEVYIAGAENSTLFLYQFDRENRFVTHHAEFSIAKIIQSFKIISLSSDNEESTKVEDSIVVILSIEDENKTQYLKWYYLQDQKFYAFWIWELLRTVKSLKHFKINGEHKLLVLYEEDVYFNQSYSLVEVYDLKTRGQFSKELSCQFLVNEVSDVEICQSQEGSRMIALMDNDHVMLHEYKEILMKCVLKPVKNITVSSINRMLCFESCNRKHFGIAAGSLINFFTFQSDEFVYEENMDALLNGIGDVHFITTLSVDTYRNDVVLLIQLKNSTVLSLIWQNSEFRFVQLPNNKLDKFDLSKITIIPDYGFISGNTFVEFRVELVPLPNPNDEDLENLFRTKSLLENILNIQESKIVEIELDNQSISKNDLEVESISNSTNIDVDTLVINNIDTSTVFIRSSNITLEQLQRNYEESRVLLRELSAEISKLENEVDEMVPISLKDINLFDEIDVLGNLEISGTAFVESLFSHSLNGFEMDKLLNSCLSSDQKITGNKTFPTIDFSEGNLKIKNLNGAPIETYQFHDETTFNYPDIDFTKINKLVIKGNLNITSINNVDWNSLMDQLVFKNKKKFIPGKTKISGNLTTKFTQTTHLNDLRYPLDYIMKSGPGIVDVTGVKTFETLTVSDLKGLKTINDIDIDEFIILTADQNLEHEIIFENLVIEESLQIDGTIEGLPEQSGNPDLTLLNSNVIQSPATINKLYVSGKVYVQNSIDGIEWSELDDLILKTDENVKVTGIKTFTDNVHIKGNLEIRSGIINGHSIEDIITVDTRQILPNLSEITGDVSFSHVTYEDVDNLENELREDVDELSTTKCSTKSFVFSKKLIIDEFSVSIPNGNDTELESASEFDNTFNNTSFEILKCNKLIVSSLESHIVNGINLKELESKRITRSTYQEISGMVKINNFETDRLHTQLINNRSHEQFQNLTRKINSYYKELLLNKRPLESVTTEKFIVTSEINGKNLQEFWNLNHTTGFVLRGNGSVENLIIEGLVNGFNFTEKYFDCVLKTDKNVIIKGPKNIEKFTADHLEVQYINGHAVDDIITNTKHQTLIGPLVIKGSAYVSETFGSDGKINEVDFKNIHVDIQKLEDSVYKFTGDFVIDNCTSINNLVVAQKIQGQDINIFMENLIYLNDTDIEIPCTKILSGPVQFNDYITVTKNLAGIDLEKFYENAIRIDEPTFVNSSVIFADDVFLDKDLTVVDSLKVGTIKGININDLIENAVYINRPTSILGNITLSSITFKSDITVKYWNDTDLDKLLTLAKDEVIQDTLIGENINAENLTILGLLNNQNLTQIYENTFMISADQHIRGNISFLNNTYVHGDFISRYVNDIDMTKIISLENSDPMEGDFIFDSPVVFHDDITVMQYLNNINISQWQSDIVMPSSPKEKIISGNWTINGDVDFNGNISGSGYINDISIDSLASTVKIQNERIKQSLSYEMNNIQTICKNLQEQRKEAVDLLHQFKSFEYFRVLQFDKQIESMHHFEFNDSDYILVNFETCQADIYAYTNEGFLLFANASEFGSVKEYLDFNYENHLYLVTVGKLKCGRNSASLWMLMNDELVHIYDFGNVTSVEKLNTSTFVLVIDHQVQEWSVLNIHRKIFEPSNTRAIVSNKIKFLKNGKDILLASCDIIYRFESGISKLGEIKNPFKSIEISSFRAGIYEKEYVLVHDEQISNDHFFIYDQDLLQPKELQSVRARKANSFNMINFEGLYESLLIFSENKKEIQIYEYKGIENFKFHSRIPMKVDKLYTFQLKTHPYFVKRRCIAVIYDSKITILVAKMYGEKLNSNSEFICSVT